MRILLRTFGTMLIAIAIFLWAFRRQTVPAQPVQTTPLSTPDVMLHSQPANATQPTGNLRSTTSTPASRVDFLEVNGAVHSFEVLLSSKDGWYDTGIPVTSDVSFELSCSPKRGYQEPLCTNSLLAMIAGSVFDHRSSLFDHVPMTVRVKPPRGTAMEVADDVFLPQLLMLPDDAMETLKLKNASTEKEMQSIDYQINVVVPVRKGGLSAAQRRELDALRSLEAR